MGAGGWRLGQEGGVGTPAVWGQRPGLSQAGRVSLPPPCLGPKLPPSRGSLPAVADKPDRLSVPRPRLSPPSPASPPGASPPLHLWPLCGHGVLGGPREQPGSDGEARSARAGLAQGEGAPGPCPPPPSPAPATPSPAVPARPLPARCPPLKHPPGLPRPARAPRVPQPPVRSHPPAVPPPRGPQEGGWPGRGLA